MHLISFLFMIVAFNRVKTVDLVQLHCSGKDLSDLDLKVAAQNRFMCFFTSTEIKWA